MCAAAAARAPNQGPPCPLKKARARVCVCLQIYNVLSGEHGSRAKLHTPPQAGRGEATSEHTAPQTRSSKQLNKTCVRARSLPHTHNRYFAPSFVCVKCARVCFVCLKSLSDKENRWAVSARQKKAGVMGRAPSPKRVLKVQKSFKKSLERAGCLRGVPQQGVCVVYVCACGARCSSSRKKSTHCAQVRKNRRKEQTAAAAFVRATHFHLPQMHVCAHAPRSAARPGSALLNKEAAPDQTPPRGVQRNVQMLVSCA